MILIKSLVWDEWNKKHIKKHRVEVYEVEEVLQAVFVIRRSYRTRLLIKGTTKSGRLLKIILSPEDKKSKLYKAGTYYVITAFEPKEKI